MTQLSENEMTALKNLIDHLNTAENTVVEDISTVVDNIRRSPRLADKKRVDYAILHNKGTTYGGKRKMRGGSICTEGEKAWAYNLAIDSVLVMAGATGITVGVFTGWEVLSAFITAFGLGAPFLAIIEAVYDILRVISSHVLMKIPAAAWSSITTSATFSTGFAYDSIVEILQNSNQFIYPALVRYILTENTAINDIRDIIKTLKETYSKLSDNVGVLTRNGQMKMDQLQRQIDELTSMATTQAAAMGSAAQSTADIYQNIKRLICSAIDAEINSACMINEIIQLYGFKMGENTSCTISGGRRRRKSKHSTRRGKRSTKRTKKNSRRSSRRK